MRVVSERTYVLAPGRPEFLPDPVEGPEIHYGPDGASVDYVRRDGGWARVVFDRLDSLRVSRGEYPPYLSAEDDTRSMALAIVRPSTWLRERYEYERGHYGNSYAFNNDVDEMLLEFEHYLFTFHDEFVEALAGGVHVDLSDGPYLGRELHQRVGWADLPEDCVTERWDCSGISCQVRVDPRPRAEVIEASSLADQAVVQVALELDGRAFVSHRLAVRTRDGHTKSRWRGAFGAAERTFTGVPSLDDLRPLAEEHAAQVRARRAAMGKY